MNIENKEFSNYPALCVHMYKLIARCKNLSNSSFVHTHSSATKQVQSKTQNKTYKSK